VGKKNFLLMGDADAETEERLVWQNILRPAQDKLNYLKVSHHGSKDGTTKTLLEVIKPEVAIISVGKNGYGHPSEEVLERLSVAGTKIWRTDERGDIKIEVD
jgi:competence protein ComEC